MKLWEKWKERAETAEASLEAATADKVALQAEVDDLAGKLRCEQVASRRQREDVEKAAMSLRAVSRHAKTACYHLAEDTL